MNRFILRLASFLVVIGLLVGCAADESNKEGTSNNSQTEEVESESSSEEEKESVVVITISKDKGEEVITEKEVPFEEGAILMEVMEENFDIENDGGFIASIDGIAPEEKEEKAWIYAVNDETAMVGAEEFELNADDKVNFDLQAWE